MNHFFKLLLIVGLFFIAFSCNKKDIEKIENRQFKMGFSTWSYGPNETDLADNYNLIKTNGDIYSEQVDDKIPWNAWINGTSLPTDFVANIDYRVGQLDVAHEVLLSISPLNTDRNDFILDWDGSEAPVHTSMNDSVIKAAYIAHVLYLVERLTPNYLVISMESTDLLGSSVTKWEEFKLFMADVRSQVRLVHPTLKITESVVLHNWYNPAVDDPVFYQKEVKDYVNEMDFAAISFYPFFAGLNKPTKFQKAFDFLHENVSKPIAFVETTHLANDLEIANYGINISSSVNEQKQYLETLLLNADEAGYMFVIWWSFRDYDALWETFPEEVKDIGKLWRDTGLQDENGAFRPAFDVWKDVFEK